MIQAAQNNCLKHWQSEADVSDDLDAEVFGGHRKTPVSIVSHCDSEE